MLLSVGKTFLPTDDYELLLRQASSPDFGDDEDVIPSEYTSYAA